MLKPLSSWRSSRTSAMGVQVFADALVLKPEAIVLGDHARVDDFTRLEGGQGLETGSARPHLELLLDLRRRRAA